MSTIVSGSSYTDCVSGTAGLWVCGSQFSSSVCGSQLSSSVCGSQFSSSVCGSALSSPFLYAALTSPLLYAALTSPLLYVALTSPLLYVALSSPLLYVIVLNISSLHKPPQILVKCQLNYKAPEARYCNNEANRYVRFSLQCQCAVLRDTKEQLTFKLESQQSALIAQVLFVSLLSSMIDICLLLNE
jgi:hypothetical protein